MGRNYIVESDFVYEGHRCVVIFGDHGYRCGYVGVSENSPLYGMEATDSVEVDMSEFRNEPLGHRGIMSVLALAFREEEDKIPLHAYFNVHGSITYAGGSLMYPVKSLLWWFGFDCGHAGDGIDLEVVKKNWGHIPHVMHTISILESCNPYQGLPVRSKEYCEEECINLVKQMIILEHKMQLHS